MKTQQNALIKNSVLALTAAAALHSTAIAEPAPVSQKPQPQRPEAFGGGNQYGGTVGVKGVPITPNVRAGGWIDFNTQPRLTPQGGGVGVEFRHNWFGR